MPQKRKLPGRWSIKVFWEDKLGDINANRCFACGWGGRLERCHIIAKHNGGNDNAANLHVLCAACHDESECIEGKEYFAWFNYMREKVSQNWFAYHYQKQEYHIKYPSNHLVDWIKKNRKDFYLKHEGSSIKLTNPEANQFVVGMMDCIADCESQMLSMRTIDACRAAKSRGVVLGNPRLDEFRNNDTSYATAAKTEQAQKRNADVRETINEMVGAMPAEQRDCVSLRKLASLLNGAGYTTARGKAWGACSVSRVFQN